MLEYRKMSVYRNAEDTEGKRVNLGYVVTGVTYGPGSHPTVTNFRCPKMPNTIKTVDHHHHPS